MRHQVCWNSYPCAHSGACQVVCYCKTTNFCKRLFFVNCNFSWFVSINFRKLSPPLIMKKPLVKTNIRHFVQFTKLTKISRVRKYLALQYQKSLVTSLSWLTITCISVHHTRKIRLHRSTSSWSTPCTKKHHRPTEGRCPLATLEVWQSSSISFITSCILVQRLWFLQF